MKKEVMFLQNICMSNKNNINKIVKRMNYKKINRSEAQKLIDKSLGMSKAKFNRLWDIAHDSKRKR